MKTENEAPRSIRRRWLLLVPAAVVAAALLGFTFWPRTPEEQPLCREYPVEVQDLVVGIDATGSISSHSTSQTAPVPVTVETYEVQMGDTVQKGDVLARYDKKELEKQVQTAKDTLNEKQAALDQLDSQIASSRSKLEQEKQQLRASGQSSRQSALQPLEQECGDLRSEAEQAKQEARQAADAKQQAQTERDGRAQAIVDCDVRLSELAAQKEDLQRRLEELEQSAEENAAEIERVRLEIAQNDLDSADVTARREKLATTDYDTLIAQHDSEEQSARSRQTQAEQKLAEAQQRLEEKKSSQQQEIRREDEQVAALDKQAETDQKALDAQRKTAVSARDTAREELRQLEQLQKDPTLKASCGGVVLAVTGKTGVQAQAGEQLVTVGDAGQRVLRLYVEPMDVVDVEPGQEVSFYVDAYPNDTFTGTVLSVSGIQGENGKFEVQASFQQTEEQLLEGMGANATIVIKQKKEVLAVSNKAIRYENGKSYVDLVDAAGNLERREITTGFSDGRMTEVLSGLSQGDVAVVEEQYEA